MVRVPGTLILGRGTRSCCISELLDGTHGTKEAGGNIAELRYTNARSHLKAHPRTLRCGKGGPTKRGSTSTVRTSMIAASTAGQRSTRCFCSVSVVCWMLRKVGGDSPLYHSCVQAVWYRLTSMLSQTVDRKPKETEADE